MADFDSSLPVRTEINNSVSDGQWSIADGETNTYLWEIFDTKEGAVAIREPSSGNVLSVNADGSLNANIVTAKVGDQIHEYDTESSGVPSTPVDMINYTVTAGKILSIKAVQVAASGKYKAELICGTASQAVWFGSTAEGSVELTFPQPIEVAAGVVVKITVTNRDKANADLYAFLNGVEVDV